MCRFACPCLFQLGARTKKETHIICSKAAMPLAYAFGQRASCRVLLTCNSVCQVRCTLAISAIAHHLSILCENVRHPAPWPMTTTSAAGLQKKLIHMDIYTYPQVMIAKPSGPSLNLTHRSVRSEQRQFQVLCFQGLLTLNLARDTEISCVGQASP